MSVRATSWRDAGIALLLAGLLGAVWTIRDWPALSILRLPDTDDVMRLQQVRDWIGGQPFTDVSQHRLGTGLAMHWSRVADLAPAAGIGLLTPLIGRQGAELATVILWPLALFAAALLLVGRIARALDAPPPTAMLVASIAYPATTVFLPGRIDHHGLQVVLLLGAVRALVSPATAARGAAIGLLAATSVTIGLETAPLFLAIGGALVIAWIGEGVSARLAGLAIGAGAGLCAARFLFASDAFPYPACDGFTLDAWRAGLIGSGGALALAAWSPASIRTRIAATGAVALVVGIAAALVTPRCLSPYGGVDPVLARIWLAHVAEAQSVVAADPATALGYVGLPLAGLAAALWRCRTRDTRWAVMLLVQLAAFAVTAVQLRGAYAAAMLAAPALAATIAAARRAGSVRLVGAWLMSTGMLYPIAAQALPSTSTPPRPLPADGPRGDCGGTALLSRLAALPPGTVMAPIDVGAYALAATRDRLVAAPYHRNGAGNLAMFAFYGGTPARARTIARDWQVAYVIVCAAMPIGPTARALEQGTAPGFDPVASFPDGARIVRFRGG